MPCGSENMEYRIAFSALKGITAPLAEEILARVGDERRFFELTESQLASILGCRTRMIEDDSRGQALEAGRREADFLSSSAVKPIYFSDDVYPRRLKGCVDAPVMLYGIGNTNLNESRVISIVGTRHATPYGLSFIHSLVSDLKAKVENVVIVSGLAYGVDVAAHKEAIKAGFPTVAVLAHGLTTIYPAAHRGVAVDMTRDGGLLLTEYRSDAAVHRGNFLARNRIVAGISDCVIVVESAKKGGALVTAKIASNYDRDVFALPGRVSDTYSEGCNSLISSNIAGMITCADDLVSAMGWPVKAVEGEQKEIFAELSPERQAVVDYLTQNGEAMLNKMAIDLNRPIAKLMALLIDMEFDELIISMPGGRYALTGR